jgi:hypothetical protein
MVITMGETGGPLDDDRGFGVGEVHILSTEKVDAIISAPNIEEAVRGLEDSELIWERDFSPLNAVEYLNLFLGPLAHAKINADLKLYVHRVREVPRRNPSMADLERGLEGIYEREHHQVQLGTIQVRKSRIFFNEAELHEEALGKWLRVCLRGIRMDDSFSTERATELAKLIGAHLREAELRSLETLRRTLGDDAAEQLLREGKVTVRAPSGDEYVITDSARVYRRAPSGRMRSVCVVVKGGADLPKYDRVLAKYLVIRDHPEQIETLHERGWLDREREMLAAERVLAAEREYLHRRLAELARLEQAQMRAGED